MLKQRVHEPTGKYLAEIGFGGIPIIQMGFDEAVEVVSYALDKGIEYLDTARAYGDSEAKIGAAIEGRRGRVVLATKTMARDYDGAMRELQESLTALNTDYLDVWQLHDISTPERFSMVTAANGAMAAFRRMKDQGVVRHLGVTGHDNATLLKCIRLEEFSSVLATYNLAIHDAELEVIPEARKRDMAFIAMKPLSGGMFFRDADHAVSPLHAWWFVLANKNINVALAGANCKRDIDQALEASNTFRKLTEEELKEALDRATWMGETICRNCGYCRDCPEGLDVAAIMQLYDRIRAYGYEWPYFLSEYGALEKKAEDCSDCGQCEEKCPYNLPIRERLGHIKKRYAGLKQFGET